MLETIDLSSIQDENARQLIVQLLSLIEALSADMRDAQAENQRLRDENNRLKGEQGKPNIKANTPKLPRSNYSSEQERRKPKPRQKRSKKATLEIHREQRLEVDKASLPADAQFKGYEDVVVQDVVFRADNVRFHKEKYWAGSTGQTRRRRGRTAARVRRAVWARAQSLDLDLVLWGRDERTEDPGVV